MTSTLTSRIERDAKERWGLQEQEFDLADQYGRFDNWVKIGTIVIAVVTAVTVWPAAIATWIGGVLAVLTALVASTRTVYDFATRRTEIAQRATILRWSAKRLYRLMDDLNDGVIDPAVAREKYETLVEEAKDEVSKAVEETRHRKPSSGLTTAPRPA